MILSSEIIWVRRRIQTRAKMRRFNQNCLIMRNIICSKWVQKPLFLWLLVFFKSKSIIRTTSSYIWIFYSIKFKCIIVSWTWIHDIMKNLSVKLSWSVAHHIGWHALCFLLRLLIDFVCSRTWVFNCWELYFINLFNLFLLCRQKCCMIWFLEIFCLFEISTFFKCVLSWTR